MKTEKKIVTASLEIKNCQQCPFLEQKAAYTEDSWERPHDWFCKKKDGKQIAGSIDWYEEDKEPIPEWCPLIKK